MPDWTSILADYAGDPVSQIFVAGVVLGVLCVSVNIFLHKVHDAD